MILLRNLLLAVGAFVVTGYGFYAWLVHRLPPDQIHPGFAIAEVGALSGAVIREPLSSTFESNATTNSRQPPGSSASAPAATATITEETSRLNPTSAPTSSGVALFMAVVDDFLAASKQGAEAEAVREQAAFEARYRVPDWLAEHFDRHAASVGNTLSSADKAALLATLLELRQMKMERLGNQPSSSLQPTDISLLSDWPLARRAMQAELQFRSTLHTGLAGFMKSLTADELQRLLTLPLDQSLAPGQPAAAHPVGRATAMSSAVLR